MTTILDSHPNISAPTRWQQLSHAAGAARQLLPMWGQYEVRCRHQVPTIEAAIELAEIRAAYGDDLPPHHDPSTPVQFSDPHQLAALSDHLG